MKLIKKLIVFQVVFVPLFVMIFIIVISGGASSANEKKPNEIDFGELSNYEFQWPTLNPFQVNSPYGPRPAVMGAFSFHTGIDCNCYFGDPIYAALDGTVEKRYQDQYGGYTLVINHGSGVTTTYIHMQAYLVNVGDIVKRGQVIAECGSTGWSTGAHLHFEIAFTGVTVDPMPYLIKMKE